MDEALSFGAWLKRRRRALDLTQAELARRVGCARVTLQKIELEERRPSREIVARLAELLEVVPTDRAAFLRAARGELLADSLPTPDRNGSPTPFRTRLPPPVSRSQAVLNNLPAPTTRIVGRTHEIAFARALLRQPMPRLLTFTGAGGSGKTCLALVIAREVVASFRDGVVFVSLAPISDPRLVGSTIAQALGLKERGGEPLGTLLHRHLQAKQLLLVLDNFEQVLDAAPLVAELLAAAPELRVLVTSRAPLRLRGEQECPVLPLGLPDLRRLPPPALLTQHAAIALFVQCVQAVKPDFQITDANARAVAEVCVRLDGLPLAIELVAARTKLFGLQTLLARLEGRLGLLTDGPRDLPARQQTLRSTLDWSYQLLESAQQILFARLGVFVGGATVDAVERVCNADEDLPMEVVDGLAALLDRSLLWQTEEVGGEFRFSFLATIQEYAVECLAMSGELAMLQQRHANYYLALAEAAAPLLDGPDQGTWLDRLEQEHDNLRAVLAWTQAGPPAPDERAEVGVRLAAALRRFWEIRGHHREGRTWLTAVLSRRQLPSAARLSALLGASAMAYYQDDEAEAERIMEEALGSARELGDRQATAMALFALAHITRNRGDHAAAMVLAEESLAVSRAVGDTESIARGLRIVGSIAGLQGDPKREAALLEESLQLFRTIGHTSELAFALRSLAERAHQLGDAERATTLLEEGLALSRASGDTWNRAWTLLSLGRLLRDQHSYPRAATVLQEGRALLSEMGNTGGVVEADRVLDEIARLQGAGVQRPIREREDVNPRPPT